MPADPHDGTPKAPENFQVEEMLADSDDMLILHAGDWMESLSLESVSIKYQDNDLIIKFNLIVCFLRCICLH